jgi:hypothetical protein
MRSYVARGALVVVVAALVAGCGGGSSGSNTTEQVSTFRGDFKASLAQFKQTAGALGVAIQSASHQTDAQIATEFKALATEWQADLTHLKALTPPPSVSGQYSNLVGGATRTETDLKNIVTAAQTHDAAKAKQLGFSLVKDVLAAKAAALAIQKKLAIT